MKVTQHANVLCYGGIMLNTYICISNIYAVNHAKKQANRKKNIQSKDNANKNTV